jgi:hypothetical protein
MILPANWKTLALLAIGLGGIASRSDAVIVTVPPGLNPGDTYRLVFVTSTPSLGVFVNIADYNANVATIANSVTELNDLGATWKAIGSTNLTSAFDNVAIPTAGVRIYRLDGLKVATGTGAGTGGLFSGSILNPININELGGLATQFVRTGSLPTGLVHPISPLGGVSNTLGDPSAVDTHWITHTATLQGIQFPLYAISSEITVPSIQRPGDYNNNGIVDAADYTVWRHQLNQSVTIPNDTTPGSVNAGDYNVWRAHFGQHSGSGSGINSNAAVPEPATAAILILPVVCWSLRRRRAG